MQAEPQHRHQLPPPHQPWAQPAAGSSRLGFTGLLLSACSCSNPDTALPVAPRCPTCPHCFCQPQKGSSVLGLRLGRGRCAELSCAVVNTEKQRGLWGHTDRSSGNDLFQGIGTWAQAVGSPWQWRRELSKDNLSYHRVKRTHFPCSTDSQNLYCLPPWLCNTEGVPARHMLVAHVQPPRQLQRTHPSRKKKIPKSNSKTSCANKALMCREFETEDITKSFSLQSEHAVHALGRGCLTQLGCWLRNPGTWCLQKKFDSLHFQKQETQTGSETMKGICFTW